MHNRVLRATVLASLAGVAMMSITPARATTYLVAGTANPFLAGAAAGQSVAVGGAIDAAPFDAPVAVPVMGGQTLAITYLSGEVSNCDCGLSGPAGDYPVASATVVADGFTEIVNGYASLPINSLIGVFDAGATNSVFEIGYGGIFTVPAGATTLYLATVDGYQWSNNPGAFEVSVAPVPEPATWALMLAGFGLVGLAIRQRARARSTSVKYALG